MKITTKQYSKLVRETASQNGVELIKDQRWTDGTGPQKMIIDSDRVVTFGVNTTDGNFDQFITDLTVKTGNAPRFTTPRQRFDYVRNARIWQKVAYNYEFTYVKFNCEMA